MTSNTEASTVGSTPVVSQFESLAASPMSASARADESKCLEAEQGQAVGGARHGVLDSERDTREASSAADPVSEGFVSNEEDVARAHDVMTFWQFEPLAGNSLLGKAKAEAQPVLESKFLDSEQDGAIEGAQLVPRKEDGPKSHDVPTFWQFEPLAGSSLLAEANTAEVQPDVGSMHLDSLQSQATEGEQRRLLDWEHDDTRETSSAADRVSEAVFLGEGDIAKAYDAPLVWQFEPLAGRSVLEDTKTDVVSEEDNSKAEAQAGVESRHLDAEHGEVIFLEHHDTLATPAPDSVSEVDGVKAAVVDVGRAGRGGPLLGEALEPFGMVQAVTEASRVEAAELRRLKRKLSGSLAEGAEAASAEPKRLRRWILAPIGLVGSVLAAPVRGTRYVVRRLGGAGARPVDGPSKEQLASPAAVEASMGQAPQTSL